jgi:hypothetical protein
MCITIRFRHCQVAHVYFRGFASPIVKVCAFKLGPTPIPRATLTNLGTTVRGAGANEINLRSSTGSLSEPTEDEWE